MLSRLSWVALVLFSSLQARADFDVFGSGASQFQIEFVTVGDPGNQYSANQLNLGKVDYEYRISKFEISREMISTASSAGVLGLTMADMSSLGGNGNKRPATGLSWNEAARFVNWLNTSNGFSEAYKFTIKPGTAGYDPNANLELWLSGDSGYNAANPFRNSLAKYFLPSIDEWHKAAYHDPNATNLYEDYWEYATQSMAPVLPTATSGSTTPKEAVYNQLDSQGPADIDNAGGLSHWGTMGQGGNVFEWNESGWDSYNPIFDPGGKRFVRGGSWKSIKDYIASDLIATVYSDFAPASKGSEIGFRIASTSGSTAVPEPSSWLLVSMSAAGGWVWRRRRTRMQQNLLNEIVP